MMLLYSRQHNSMYTVVDFGLWSGKWWFHWNGMQLYPELRTLIGEVQMKYKCREPRSGVKSIRRHTGDVWGRHGLFQQETHKWTVRETLALPYLATSLQCSTLISLCLCFFFFFFVLSLSLRRSDTSICHIIHFFLVVICVFEFQFPFSIFRSLWNSQGFL